MRFYTLQEVVDDAKAKKLDFPFVFGANETLVFTQLYSDYLRAIKERAMGNAFKQQCSFPFPDILPTEFTRYWLYTKDIKDVGSRMFFKTSRSQRMLEVVHQNWSPKVCRKLYVFDRDDMMVLPFSGSTLNSPLPSVPDNLIYM